MWWKRKNKAEEARKRNQANQQPSSQSSVDDWAMNSANSLSITSPLNPAHANWGSESHGHSTPADCGTSDSPGNHDAGSGSVSDVGSCSVDSGGSDGSSSF